MLDNNNTKKELCMLCYGWLYFSGTENVQICVCVCDCLFVCNIIHRETLRKWLEKGRNKKAKYTINI